MVLTTVPQTALPVLAAEGDVQDEIQIDLPAESEEETPADSVEPVAGEEGGETEEEETPAPAESEITEEESEEEEPAEDADVTEEADGEAEEETPVEPAEEEITEPEQEESEDESSDATVNNVINAAVNSESVITYKSVDATDATKGADTATIEWKQGCVSGDKLVNGKDLRFTVAPVAGRSVSKVEITIDGKTETLTADAASKIYTVENAKFSKKETVEGNETTKALSAEIVITTAAQTYTVTFGAAADAAADSYEIYTVTEQELADKSKVKVLDTKVTAPVASAVFDTAVEYAVVATTGNKFVEITAEGKPVTATAGSLNKKDDPESADKTACYTFSLKPSDYVAAGDEGFMVKVKAVKKAELTAKFAEGDTFTVAAPTETTGADIVPYVSTDFGTALVEGAEGLDKKKLAFKLTPVTDYKITDVTAKAVDADKEETTLTVTRPTGADGTKAEEDTIALAPVKAFSSNTEIIITVTTEYTDTANVHAISFKAATGKTLDHVDISLTDGTSTVAIKDNAASVTGDTAKVTVSPHPGYEFAKATEDDVKANAGLTKNDPYITVIRNKSYPAVTEGTAMDAATGKEEKKVKVTFDSSTGAAEAVSVELASGKDAAYEGAAADAADRDYVVTSVEVVIDASLAANTEEKIVFFDDRLKDGYEITTEGVIIDETATGKAENDTWVIPEGVDELEFAVTTTSTPAVTCTGFEDEIKETSSEGGKYTYTIPTSAIDTKTGGKGTITIKEAAVTNQNVNVKVDTVSNVKSVQAEIDGIEKAEYIFNGKTPDSDGFYKVATDAVKGKELVLNVTPADGAKITKLSYTMGEGEEAAAGEGTVAEDGTASLTIDSVTADVAVSVESASDYAVVLTGAGIGGKDGVYKADYTVKDITVTLVKTGTAYTERFYDIIVKDGSDIASTDAVLAADGQSATIKAIAKNEYGKTLTIEVYTGKETKYTATLETTAYSEAVTVTRVDTGKAVKETDTVGMMADSKMEFTVTPAKGAELTDLAVEILSTKENAADKDNTDAAALLETPVFKDGKLTLQAKPAAAAKGQVLVSIYNTNEEADKDGKKPHKPMTGGKFIVDLKDPLIKTDEIKKVTAAVASATNRNVRLNLNVEFKNKKNPPAKPIVGALYYKVEVDTPTGAPEVVAPIDKYTQYVKITDFANPAVTLPISLVKSNTEDKDGIVADIAAVISSNAKVSLVQSISDKDLADPKVTVDEAADCAAGPDTLTATAALATKLPVYETKLAVKAVNGATVFTGQNDAKVATPTFTKDTSYDAVYVQLVNSKTGIALSEESAAAGKANKVTDTGGSTSAWVDGNDNSIHVSVDGSTYINADKYTTDYYKNLGVKVIAVGPDDSYRASAVVKLKVQQGIESIYFDDSKAALPETLYKESDKKPASAKMTVVLNGGQKEYKPAKSTVAWSVAPELGVSASAYEKAAVEGKKPLVSVKNGKLTVDKNYRIQDTVNGDTYTVTVKAADFARSEAEEVTAEIDFTITGKKNDISKVVLLDENNEILSSPLSAETFDDPVYVAAVSSEAKEPKKGQTYEDKDFLPVTFKSSAKAAVDVVPDSEYSEYGYNKYSNKGRLIFHKPGTKIKITASTVDGGKVLKKDAVFDVNGYGTLGLWLKDTDNVSNDPGTLTRSYAGGSNQRYDLYLAHKNGDQWEEDYDYKSVKVKVSGGKFVANKDWAKNPSTNRLGHVIVVSDLKKATAEITLTDTATKDPATKKNKEYKYTITNTNKSITEKAPSIKLIDPKKPAKGSQTLTWQITDKNKNNYAGSYVMLAPDYTVASNNSAFNAGFVGNGTIRKIDENGQFTLENKYLYAGGSYKMIATVGELEGGRFTTSTKDAKISFTVSKDKKANNNLSVTASYTLDPESAAFARIAVKTDASYTVSDAMNVIKKSKDQGKDVHTNDFTTYFEVKGNKGADGNLIRLNNADEEYAYIGLKDNLSARMIAEIMDKTKKDDCTGYITVDNGTYRKDIQIKISFKTLKYTATSASVFATQTAATPVVQVMNGKVPVKAAFAKIDGTSEFAKDVKVQEDGTLLITSNTPVPAAGKYDVNLLVVPEDSRYIVSDGKGGWTFINKGEGATADPLNEDALYKDGYAVPVTAKIEVKALDTKKVVNIKCTNVTLNTGLFDAVENGNGYKLGEAGKTGSYVVDIPYTFVAGNTAIGDTATDVAVELKDKDGKNLNEIGADKELLVKASKQSVGLEDGTFKQVIRLEVSKKALVALSAMSAKDKPITVYGKKLTVPVVLKYTNGVQAETVKFNITMPKKAPKEFKDVVADVKAAELDKTQSGNKTAAQAILNELVGKVVKKAEAVIAADTDVIVGQTPLVKKDWGETEDPTPETSDAAADVIDSGTANITLTLTNNADANAETKTEKVLVPCQFTIKHSDGDVAAVANAISSGMSGIKVDNTTTDVTLKEEIEKLAVGSKTVSDYLATGKGNLSLEILNFKNDKATAKKSGSVTATIRIKDILAANSKQDVPFSKAITKLDNIAAIKDAVVTATDATALATIITACSGQDKLIKAAVLAAAKDAAKGNPDIEVGFAQKDGKDDYTFVPITENTDNAGTYVDGSVTYTLVVKNKVTGRTMKCAEVTANLDKANKDKYVTVAKAKELVEKAIVDSENSNAALKMLVGTSNDADTIQTAIKNAADGALAGVTGYACEWKKLDGDKVDFNYTPADSTNDGKLKFTMVVKSKNEFAAAATDGKAEVALAETTVLPHAGAYQSAAEMKAAIEKMEKSIAVEESTIIAADYTEAIAAIQAEVDKLKAINSKLSPVVSATTGETDATKNSVWTKGTDENKTATLTNVKIVIDAKTPVTVPQFTFTVKAQTTSPAQG